MKVRISDNVNGENRHVNATPKGIDNHPGRDNSSCAEVKCTAASCRIAYAEQLSAQAPLLVDCRKDLDQVRVGKGGVEVQGKIQTHKNLNTTQGFSTMLGARPRLLAEEDGDTLIVTRTSLPHLTTSPSKHVCIPVAGERPDLHCASCRYKNLQVQMDYTLATESETLSQTSIDSLRRLATLDVAPIPNVQREYTSNISMPSFIQLEENTAPLWVRDLEGYHDIGDLYLENSSSSSSRSSSHQSSIVSEGPSWRNEYWDDNSTSHSIVFQSYQDRARGAFSNMNLKLNMDKVLLYSEKVALLFVALSGQTTYRGFITTIVYALKDFGVISTRKSLMMSVIALCREFLDSDIDEQFPEYSATDDEYDNENRPFYTQSAEKIKVALDAIIDCLRNPARVAKNPVVRGIVRFLRAVTALGMMTYCQGDYCLKGIKLFAIEPISGGVFEVFAVLADSLQNFLDYGYAMVMEKSFMPINYSFDKLHDLELRVAEMDAWMPFFENGRLQERGMQRSDYLIKLKTLKEHIIAVRRAAPDKFAEKTLTMLYAKMEKLSTRATMVTLASGLKYCPFGYSIAGPAGIGKSSVNDHLINYFFQWKKRTQDWKPEGKDAEYRVTVNMSDKFQSEVFSHHIVATLDDFMNKRAEKVAPGETPHDLLIKIVNNVPCTALKPDVESKGAVPMNFELVGLTTNVPHLHATLFVNDEYSILRRVSFTVFQYVKPEFRKEGQECLDPVKAMGHTDLWDIDVQHPIAVKEGNKMVIKWKYYDLPPSISTEAKKISKGLNLHDLLVLYGHELDRHHMAQVRLLREASNDIKTCEHGFPHSICSLCTAIPTVTPEIIDMETEQSVPFIVNSGCEDEPDLPFAIKPLGTIVEDNEEVLHYPPGPDCPPLVRRYAKIDTPSQLHAERGAHMPLPIVEDDRSNITPVISNASSSTTFIPVLDYGFNDESSAKSDTVPLIVQVHREVMTSPVWMYGMEAFENFVEVVCPWRITDNPINVGRPWLIDWVPRIVLNNYPSIIQISHFSRLTIRNRRIIAALLTVSLPLHLIYLIVCICLRSLPLMTIVSLIFHVLFLIHMHNQHADMVARYYVQRNLRWSNLLTLQWMPRVMRNRLRIIWTLVFILGVVTCVKKIANKIFPVDKVIDSVMKKKGDEEAEPEKVDGTCQGGMVSIPDARPAWGGVSQVVPLKLDAHNVTFSQMFNIVKRNMATISYETDEGMLNSCTCLIVKSAMILVPYHFVPEQPQLITIYIGEREASGGIIKCILKRDDGYRLPNKDLNIFHIPNLGDRRDISVFMTKYPSTDSVICKSIYKDKMGKAVMNDYFIKASYVSGVVAWYKDKSQSFETNGFAYELKDKTFIGLCGMVLICNSKVPYIHSFHTCGRDTTGVSHDITRMDIEAANKFLYKDQCSRIVPSEAGILDICRVKEFTMQSEPTRKSPLLFLDKDTAFDYYGTINTPVVKFKHSVHTTLIHEQVNTAFNIVPVVGPPPSVPTWEHHHACIVNTTCPNSGFPQSLMERATKDYLDGTLDVMSARKDLKPLDMDCILNGADGVRGLEPMNKKTSAGFPYFQSKKKLFNVDDGEPLQLTPELLSDYQRSENAWSMNKRSYEVFHQSLKDEAVKRTKKVTRTFQCSNLNLTLGLRKYYLPIVTELITRPDTYELAVGCNAEGPEWHTLMMIISKFGDERIVAGDYKNYDQRMSSQVIGAAFCILIEFAASVGYSADDIQMMTSIASEVLFPVIHMNGDIFKLFGSVTSGNSLTTILNCICNSLLHRICYFGLSNKLRIVAPPFKYVCSLMTYGDDCADSVRPGFDWFSHTNRQAFFEDFNIIYTMAEKDQASVPFITLGELSFLKRRPKFNPDTGLLMAPLEESSIFKSLQYLTRSTLTPEESVGQNVDNALAAWFQHGREVYEKRVPCLRKIMIDADLKHYSKWLDRSYDDFLWEWRQKYQAGQPAIRLEHPGRKTQECCDDIDYDDMLASKLGDMLGACHHEAVSPVETPLFRGGEADHITSSECQAGTCLIDHEIFNLYPKFNTMKNNTKSPAKADVEEATPLVGDINLEKSQKLIKQKHYKNLKNTKTHKKQESINSLEGISSVRGESPNPKLTIEEINALYAEWARENFNQTPLPTNDVGSHADRDAMFDPPIFVGHIDDKKKKDDFTVQAGTSTTSPSTQGVTSSGTMVFSDTDANVVNSVHGVMDDTRYLTANAADGMALFLSRPLLIQTVTVAVGGNTYVDFNPWKRFIENKRVINRINNYNNLRARLHVKFLINGNGFYYGKLIASYLPLRAVDNLEHDHTVASPANICLATQRPHIFLDPCMSTAGQLDLPFFFWKDALNIPTSDWNNMGQIFLESINPLRNANGSTADLTITVFAWMSEVTLDSPTLSTSTALVAQAGEYGESDIISRPASVLSNAAAAIAPALGSLGPFAMAVSSSAGLVASVAKACGYSRPVDVSQPTKMNPRHIANLANYDVIDNSTKLALDSKNEVTVDTRVMGLAGAEETSFTFLASISNYLRSVQWTSTQLTGTKLGSVRAWPLHRIAHGTLVASAYPSYALPTFDFAYWTGTFVMKIEIVCSSFHKGRLQIVYDPNNTDVAPETNIQHTYIMDISDTKELVIEIPWSQSRTFLNTPPTWPSQAITDTGLDATGSSVFANGQISIYVLNELTVPSASTLPIEINLYGSFKDDFKVMCPERAYTNAVFRNLTTQAGMQDCAEDCQMPDDTAVEYSAGGDQRSDKQLAVYAGESITSFRALWKRPSLLYIFPKNAVANTSTTYIFPIRPKPRGNVPTFTNYNTPLNCGLTLTSYAYAGWRGSLRYKCVTQAQRSQTSMYSSVFPGFGFGTVARSINYAFGTTTTINDLARAMAVLASPNRANKAQELQNSQHQPNIEAEIPFYSLNRFFPHRNIGFELQTGERIVNVEVQSLDSATTGQHEIYTCTGEDFQVGFFTGLPLMATFADPAPPVAA
nr:MAG: hypothetical protein [Marnaviridae sp.]